MSSDLLSTLLAPVERDLLVELRREWEWALPEGLRVVGLTTLGDWLFEDKDGAILMLETVEATVSTLAHSLTELEQILRFAEARDRLFLEGLALRTLNGRTLPPNHCVGFKTPPILGGATDASNVEIVPVSPYQSWTARVHRAVRAVPSGRQVTGVDVGDDGSLSVRWR